MSAKSLEALRNRISKLQEAYEKARALHATLFDLGLPDEQMLSHKLMSDLIMRIEQLSNLLARAIRKMEE